MSTPAAPPTWRDHIEVHPAAEQFPLLVGDELQALVADVRANGLREKITLHADGRLLDGRNRLTALQLAGFDVLGSLDEYAKPERFVGDDEAAAAEVVSLNIRRRHLRRTQRLQLLEKLIRANPEKSDRQHAKAAGVSHPTAGKVRAKVEANGDVASAATRQDTKGRRQPARKAAPVKVTKRDGSSRTASQSSVRRITKDQYPGKCAAVFDTFNRLGYESTVKRVVAFYEDGSEHEVTRKDLQ